MGIDEDVEKIKRFEEIEKIISSPEFNDLTITQLQEYQRELALNIPQLEENRYRLKLNTINSTISSRINDTKTEKENVIASKRFWWPFLLGVITTILTILTIYLSFFRSSGTN